jgi:energy-coupling factor transporter ATP-binding protein EcfA2
MTLLALERVCKRYTVGRLERAVLDDVSLSLDEGELVAVWGMPRSGRSTLLRIAAGIEPPDTGVVRFAGRDIGTPGGHALGRGIGYCRTAPRDREGRAVLDEVVLGLRARGAAHSVARQRAHRALDRVGAGDCAEHRIDELNGVEALRVSLARTLVLEPSLLLIDEPVTGIDLLHRDELLSLVRSLADEGIAVLMTVGEATALEVADRALRIGGGRLGGSIEPELASVSDLERHRQARG